MKAKLIKIDRNGSKHFEGEIVCDRCGGKGYYAIGVHNMMPVLSPHDGGVCWKCLGAGKVHGKWIERTPEYQAKLDAKRQAKREAERARLDAEQARIDAERAEREARERAEREAEEARIKAQKAISQHIGQIGDKVEIKATYVRSGSWEQKSFSGYGTDIMHVHTFKDPNGNVLTWKTQKGVRLEYGEPVIVKGTIKNHSEYKDEKQTELTRCKIESIGRSGDE
jgi:hypothetical protein